VRGLCQLRRKWTNRFGRFSRRIRAFVIDWIIAVLLIITVLCVVISTDSDRIGRILGFAFLGIWLLYEPLLVSVSGSTLVIMVSICESSIIGAMERSAFFKARTRTTIKSVLGLYSFITMAITSCRQAVHDVDVLTRSTLQIRDLSKASPNHAGTQGTVESSYASALRRIFGDHSLPSGYSFYRAHSREGFCFGKMSFNTMTTLATGEEVNGAD
jgi:hypothetical protein